MDPALPIAVAFIAAREGFRADPYPDQGGCWTIGYGFTVTEEGQHVTADTPPITQEAAYARLESLVARVLVLVRGMVEVPITDNQAAALTSFAYNLGTGAVRTSTLLRLLNEGNYEWAAHQFAAWVYCDGQVDQGLVNRRKMEEALFLAPDATTDQEQIPAISAASSVEPPQSANLDQETTAELNDAEYAAITNGTE